MHTHGSYEALIHESEQALEVRSLASEVNGRMAAAVLISTYCKHRLLGDGD